MTPEYQDKPYIPGLREYINRSTELWSRGLIARNRRRYQPLWRTATYKIVFNRRNWLERTYNNMNNRFPLLQY